MLPNFLLVQPCDRFGPCAHFLFVFWVFDRFHSFCAGFRISFSKLRQKKWELIEKPAGAHYFAPQNVNFFGWGVDVDRYCISSERGSNRTGI